MANKIYPKLDAEAVDATGLFSRHMLAMTQEDLNSKSDIAVQLAHRDMEIAWLRQYLWVKDQDAHDASMARYREKHAIEEEESYADRVLREQITEDVEADASQDALKDGVKEMLALNPNDAAVEEGVGT